MLKVREYFVVHNQPLAVFDWEKTLLHGESLDEVGKFLDITTEIEQITRDGMDGRIDFRESIGRRVDLINQKLVTGYDLTAILDVVRDIPLVPHAEEVIGFLKEAGYTIGIVSGGLDMFVQLGAERLYPNFLFSSRTEIKDGTISVYPLTDKGLVVRFLREEYGFRKVYAFGDGANDISMMKEADVGIGYRPTPILVPHCKYVINDLMQIPERIRDETVGH